MIERVVSELSVNVPPVVPTIVPSRPIFINLNPQCGQFPLENVACQYEPTEGFARFEAQVSQEFVRSQIMPRGRPHFSLLHVALMDDAIASCSFTLVSGQPYGQARRYLELGAAACFHREAFIIGTLRSCPRGAVLVEGFRVRWQCLPRRDRASLLHRGILQVAVQGIRGDDQISVASVECEYFLGRGVS